MKPNLASPAKKRSPWWPLNLKWVQIAIIAVILIYIVNYFLALLFPGTQV